MVSRFRRPDASKLPLVITTGYTITTTIPTETGPRSRVEAWQEGKKRKLAPANVFTLALLSTSRVINETLPILYGLNHFDFETAYAVDEFVREIGDHAVLLASVAITVTGSTFKDKGLNSVRCMATPQHPLVRKVDEESKASAADSVEEAWDATKDMVKTQEWRDVLGWNWFMIDLPLELQLERLEAFHFHVCAKLEFDGVGADDAEAEKGVADENHRSEKYKSLVQESLRRDDAYDRDMTSSQQRWLSERLKATNAGKRS